MYLAWSVIDTQIERPILLEAHAVVDDDFAAGRDLEEVVRRQRDAEHAGVEGIAGVDVSDAPKDPGREGLRHVR